MILIGSHVGMSGKEQFAGSVKEALSYKANTFMVYTGAPQNTKRRPLEELKIEEAKRLMEEGGISEFIVHAPYIINLGNTVNESIFNLAKEQLVIEMNRTLAMGSNILVLHPGSSVGAEPEKGISRIIEGLDDVLERSEVCLIALETMAGKGSELGRTIDEMKSIFEGVKDNSRLRLCLDTCHLNDAGYDIVNNTDNILREIDEKIGLNRVACAHINDSVNPLGAHKDRHANIGFGTIGTQALRRFVHHPLLEGVPMCLETPYVDKKAPYKEEIELLRQNE